MDIFWNHTVEATLLRVAVLGIAVYKVAKITTSTSIRPHEKLQCTYYPSFALDQGYVYAKGEVFPS